MGFFVFIMPLGQLLESVEVFPQLTNKWLREGIRMCCDRSKVVTTTVASPFFGERVDDSILSKPFDFTSIPSLMGSHIERRGSKHMVSEVCRLENNKAISFRFWEHLIFT